MNGTLRQVREMKAKVAGISKARATRYLWKDEDGVITDGWGGNPIPPEEIGENDVIVTWDWEGKSEPPKRMSGR